MRVGWTPNCPASSLTVRSPLSAARATWALNAAVWVFRLPAIVSPFLGHLSSLVGGPVFGVHYTLQPGAAAWRPRHRPVPGWRSTQSSSSHQRSLKDATQQGAGPTAPTHR